MRDSLGLSAGNKSFVRVQDKEERNQEVYFPVAYVSYLYNLMQPSRLFTLL